MTESTYWVIDMRDIAYVFLLLKKIVKISVSISVSCMITYDKVFLYHTQSILHQLLSSNSLYIVLFIKLSLNFPFLDNSSLFYKGILETLRELRRKIVRGIYKKYFDNYWKEQ